MNSKITQGLCATTDWKKALKLSNKTVNSLNILIRKSLRENEIDLVWDLFKQLMESKFDNSQSPQIYKRTVIVFAKYLQRFPEAIPQCAEKFLQCCERLEKVFDEESTRELTTSLNNAHIDATITNIDYS